MSDFTAKHEEELRDYFGGIFTGRMGLTSWCGPMLDHAQAAALHPIDRSAQYMPVAPTSHEAQRAAREISDDAMNAAREARRVELALLGCSDHLATLRAAFAPRGPAALNPELVLVDGEDETRRLHRESTHEDREVRRIAKRTIEGAMHRARVVRERAQEAYAESDAAVRQAQKSERRARFEASMGVYA